MVVGPAVLAKIAKKQTDRHPMNLTYSMRDGFVTSNTEGGWQLFSPLSGWLSVNKISQKVVDGFRWNLVERLGM